MMAVERQKIGQLLDSLGVTAALDKEDMVTDAVVLMKVIEADGTVNVSIVAGEGTDWITRLGLLDTANRVESLRFHQSGDGDE